METKDIRIAKGKIADEFRDMAIGETILFLTSEYNPNTVRSAKASTLATERIKGMDWTTVLSIPDKGTLVTRIS